MGLAEKRPGKTVNPLGLGQRASEKGALFLSPFVLPHEEEPLPETFEVMVAVGGVDHGLGGLNPQDFVERPVASRLRNELICDALYKRGCRLIRS